ncbi:MAG TPA: alpha/beta family hydrolase [Candidatus Acidoferrum sp.]|nr:alpha/beta family hydrolase [Candidatus Acidoferrum sp.]
MRSFVDGIDSDTTIAGEEMTVSIPVERIDLEADLVVPAAATGIVIFAHGSGSSRRSARNRFVAASLQQARLATLLMDLLTESEAALDEQTGELRFDIPFLARRLEAAIDWVAAERETAHLPVGLFGASTGGGAAIVAGAERAAHVHAIVSRGGRPDLAGEALGRVKAPTLLIVGEADDVVLGLNRTAMNRMTAGTSLEVVPGATHLFEEPGALDRVAELAGIWFVRHLAHP